MEKNKKVERNTKTLNRKKMKRVLAVVLSILMVVTVIDYSSLTKVSAEIIYGTQIDTGVINTLAWTAYDSDSDTIPDLLVISGIGAIPDKYSDSSKEAYWNYSGSIKNIIIENGVTTIGAYAFGTSVSGEGFTELTTVTLADSVTTIGECAFGCANKLADFVLGIGSQLQVISQYAFYLCSSFADQDIFQVNNLQTIGYAAFWASGFNNITVVLPTSLTSYNTTALQNQWGLTLFYPASLELTFYDNFPDLGYVIENGEVKITKFFSRVTDATIHLPETILGYPIVAVTADRGNCTIVDVKHNMVDHVCQICGYAQKCGDNIFYEYANGVLTLFGSGNMYDYSYSWNVPWNTYMAGITKVVIPNGITSIGSNAFYGATNLTDIELEEGSQLTAIQPYAFESCSSLSDTDIFIKARLQTIGTRAFCQTAYSGAVVLPSTLTSIASNSFSNVLNAALIFPAGLGNLSGVGAYMGYTITDNEATITTFQAPYYDKFPNGILLPEAIEGNKLVAVTAAHANVTLKDVMHNMVDHTCLICGYTDKCGDNVYYSFADGVLTLSGSGDMYDYAYGTTPWISLQGQITEVIVGKDITSIGAHAFSDCYNLEYLVLESGSVLQELKAGCFLRASILSDVVLPETVNYIDGAFQQCTKATVYYPEAAALVYGNAFRAAEGFVTYKMMNGKKYITSPTENMIMVPENLAFTGDELRTFALDHIGIQQYADGITVNGTNFGVDIDETKWVKSVSEPSVIDIGTYTAQFTGTFTYSGGSEAKVISKTFSVVKGNGSGTVTLEGWTYGETAKDPVSTSATNGTDNVTYKYKIKGEDDSTYSDTKPINAGTYTVKATFPATANYSEANATADFTIARLNQTTLNINDVTGMKYDNVAFTLGTTGGDGTGGVMYSVPEGNGILSISGDTATIIGAGTVTVTATKAADNIYNSITATREITIGRADTTIELNPLYVDTYAYTGTALAVPSQSDLAITGASYSDVTFTWYSDSVAEENRLIAAPSAPGTYVLVASIAETANINASSVSITVTINFFDSAVTVLYNGSPAPTVWYTGDVALTAEGFTISDNMDGTYTTSYNLTGEGTVNKTLYFKQDGTGYITDGRDIFVNIDKTLPVFSGETDGITIRDNHWKQFLNQVTFRHFFKETKDVSISATDSGSGVAKYYYYIDTTGSMTTKTAEELNALSFTEVAGGSFSISGENKYVIYAYAVDFAGNKSAYICTDGIVIDKTAPTVTLTAPAGSDIGDISATANVQMNEIGTITYVVKTSEQSSITVGDILNATEKKTVSITDSQADTDLDVALSGLTANTTYYIYAVGMDSAENNSDVASTSFTTIKTQPVFTGDSTMTLSDYEHSYSNNTNAGTPVIKDASNKAGWEAIKEQIRQTKEGDAVTIEMNGSLVVPGEVLATIRGTDTTLVFDMGNGITWSVNGQNITDNSLEDINFGVTMDADIIPENLINQVAKEQAYRSISLSYDGKFGFTAVLSINMEKKNAGLYANLFYYNPATKQLELHSVGKMNENGYVEFMFAHASDYVITISKEPMLEKAIDQIAISATKGNLYVGGTQNKSMTLKLEIPDLLKEVIENDHSKLVITYQSSNPNVATVTNTGKIIAKKPGKTTITTLVTINGVQKSFKTEIKVSKAYLKLIKSTKTLKKGKTFTFQVKGYGVNAKDITFCTSKKSIVEINKATGKAVAKSNGTDYVIAKAGNVEVKIKVKVM